MTNAGLEKKSETKYVTFSIPKSSVTKLNIFFYQIEENSRALEYLGGSRCASVMSQESGAATPTHRAEDRWKQGAKKTLLQWVANALPK